MGYIEDRHRLLSLLPADPRPAFVVSYANAIPALPDVRQPDSLALIDGFAQTTIETQGNLATAGSDLMPVPRAAKKKAIIGTAREAVVRRMSAATDPLGSAVARLEAEATRIAFPELTPTRQLQEQEIRGLFAAKNQTERDGIFLAWTQARDGASLAAIERAPAIYGRLVSDEARQRARDLLLETSPTRGQVDALRAELAVIERVGNAVLAWLDSLAGADPATGVNLGAPRPAVVRS